MNNQPLVTVITPCYNHEKYLDDYFKSIMAQTYSNIELVIFDDASTDNSKEIIKKRLTELRKRFFRVCYIKREKNTGVVPNCNEGLELANGEYICFFSSDDIMLPNKISESVNFLDQNREYGMVYSNVNILKGNHIKKRSLLKKNMPNGDIFMDLLINRNYIPAPSVCIRKKTFDSVGKFDENICAEDYQMWLKISEKFKIGYIEEPLAIYRRHKKSLSHSKEFTIKSIDSVYKFKKSFLNNKNIGKNIKYMILKNTNEYYAKIAFYNNDIECFEKYYKNYKILVNKKNIKLILMNATIRIPFLYKYLLFCLDILHK